MMRKDFWTVTVHFYPRAAEMGVTPVEASLADCLSRDDPALYRTHEFHFTTPPSRQEFMEAIRSLPWAQTWSESLFPIMDKNPFPIVDWMHKSASVYLIDGDKRVGEIGVDRNYTFVNDGYDRSISLDADMIRESTSRLKNSEEARHAIMLNESVMLERLHGMKLPILRDDIKFVIDEFLYERGFRKTKPKR